jgi:uncharacterized membrane protein
MQTNPKLSKLNWLEFVLLAAPFLFLALEWNKFPARIPIHWGMHGNINGWASKPFGLLSLPVLNVLLWSLLRFIQYVDPKVRRAGGEERAQSLRVFQIMRVALLAFTFGMWCFQMAIARGCPISMNSFAFNGCLLLFIVMGNYFATLRPNYFVGIRTPWTLENPETWRATHRLGGRIMVFGSLLLIAAEFFTETQIFAWLFVIYIFGFALWGFIYSWNYSRTHVQAR